MSRVRIQRTPLLVLLVAALVAVGASWAFYTSDGAAKAREREARLEAARANGPRTLGPTLEVSVVRAEASARGDLIELSGVLEPLRATWVSAEIAGRIVDVPAAEFAPIERGGLLVKLDPALPRAALIRAEAGHALATAELERQQRLGSRSVASEAELDRARAEERNAFAALLEARTRLGHTRIAAPFAGLVNSLDLDPGAYVQPGTRIAEILDLSQIEVTVLLGDRQVSALAAGGPVAVSIDALGNETFSGEIARIGGAPKDGGQRYPIVVLLDNAARRLRPGMLANVRFKVGAEPSIRLPARAIVNEFELDYVFVLDENDAARRLRVRTRPVPFRPDQVEIRDGLEPGQRVVVSAVEQLREGLRVIVR